MKWSDEQKQAFRLVVQHCPNNGGEEDLEYSKVVATALELGIASNWIQQRLKQDRIGEIRRAVACRLH